MTALGRNLNRSVWYLGIGLAVLFSGCGGGTKTGPSAGKYINDATEAINRGKSAESSKDFSSAQLSFNEALSSIKQGKRVARGGEYSRLSSIEKEILDNMARIQLREGEEKERMKKKEEDEARAKKAAQLTGLDPSQRTAVDPRIEQKKKSEAERIARTQKAEGALKIQENNTKARSGEEGATVAAAKKTGEGEGDEAAEEGEVKEGEGAGKAAPKGEPSLFRTYGSNPPVISVDAVVPKGEFALAYIQFFNTQTMGKRIGRVEVVFKDKTGAELMGAEGVFEFKRFDAQAPILTDQPDPMAMLAMETHQVPGLGSLKVVAVGRHGGKVGSAAQATIKAIFANGTEGVATGPNDLAPEKKPSILDKVDKE